KAEKESQPYIDHMNSGRATQSDAQVAEETIRALEYSLAQLQQDEQQKISRLEADFQFAFYNRITKYLKKYGEENGIDIVFNHEPGGQTLLYAADMFDVTDEVVAGLNKEYELEMNPVEEE
ncbi:MAG: OmpH family outer membrane protein, partial [Flavobacteriales bacterium]